MEKREISSWRPLSSSLIRSYLLLLVLSLPSLLELAQAQGTGSLNRILVDNFERPGPGNGLDKSTGAFSDPGGLGNCYVFFTAMKDQALGEKGHSLYVKWDTSKPGSWGGYWTDLGHLDLQGIAKLTFYVKGLRGKERFKVGLRGEYQAKYETKLLINDVLPDGITTEWQKVAIPLRSFKAVPKWNDVNILSFSFENAFGSDRGAILIDEISFEP
jgi:hypothetical protein